MQSKTKQAFSLIEIIVSLAIFSFIITTVVAISIKLVDTQKKIQAQLFLVQTAQTTLETMSRQIRYGYNFTGVASGANSATLLINTDQIKYSATNCPQSIIDTYGSCSDYLENSQNLVDAKNSPYIIFEAQDGNPNDFTDQNAFCTVNNKLYKVKTFQVQTDNKNYNANCADGSSMLPDDVLLESLSYDIFATNSQNPKNPMVRIKMKLKHLEAGEMKVQTTVTQRLITYF